MIFYVTIATPPVEVIRVPKIAGSFGYGAKVDGDMLLIPFNVSVIEHIELANIFADAFVGMHTPHHVVSMPRHIFDALPDYEADE